MKRPFNNFYRNTGHVYCVHWVSVEMAGQLSGHFYEMGDI